jgi:alanine dehydrogenase
VPADSRVALTPAQCKLIKKHYPQIEILVQSSTDRCFNDTEYRNAGIAVVDEINGAEVIFGIKEIPINQLIENKTYLFFSHVKKLQAHNQSLCRAMIEKNITLIDYECLEYEDGARVIGFGFFAGVVGAHNGIMAFGNRTGDFDLGRVYQVNSFNRLIKTYFGLKLPNIKVAVTGSGRVAHGLLEVMNIMGVQEVEKSDYVDREFSYPVYVQLKGADLYVPKDGSVYNRKKFHEHPELHDCTFIDYCAHTDILMNGIYWDDRIPRLFTLDDIGREDFRITTIADVTDDENGSIPCNLGDSTIENPIYGVDKKTKKRTDPYLKNSIDVMAVGNLPNELPRDASNYFGEQLLKHILPSLFGENENNAMVKNATIIEKGSLTAPFQYMSDYATGNTSTH